MNQQQPQQPPKESGEYDLAPAAPPPAVPPVSAPDPRLGSEEPSPAQPHVDLAPPAAAATPSAGDLGGLRPDLETGRAKTVRANIRCARCGIDLKDQSRSGECAACGFPVELSLQGDRLDFAQAQWVAALRNGARMLFAAAVLFVIALGVRVFSQNLVICAGLLAIAAVFDFLGVRGLSTTEPTLAKIKPKSSNALIRALAAAASGAGILVALVCLWPDCPSKLFRGVCIAALILAAVRSLPLGYSLQSLNQRVPNDSAGSEWMILGWMISLGALFIALFNVPNAEFFSEQFGIFHMVPIIIGGVFALWQLKATRTLAGDLANCAYEAEQPKKARSSD